MSINTNGGSIFLENASNVNISDSNFDKNYAL